MPILLKRSGFVRLQPTFQDVDATPNGTMEYNGKSEFTKSHVDKPQRCWDNIYIRDINVLPHLSYY